MEYFWLKIRTGAPQGLDSAGGIHVENTPQLVEIRRESWISKAWRMLKTRLFGEHKTMPTHGFATGPVSYISKGEFSSVSEYPQFSFDFSVEIPSCVDASILTGCTGAPGRLRIGSCDNIYRTVTAPDITGVTALQDCSNNHWRLQERPATSTGPRKAATHGY